MMKRWFALVLVFILVASSGHAAAKKFSDLMKDEAFAKATTEQRLEIINKKLESKEFSSSEINFDLVTRLFQERLKDEKDPDARLTAYGQLRNKFNKLPQTYELETHLISELLATTPEGQKGDLVGMMKLIQKYLDEKKTCWPTVAPLHEGMLAAHLIANAEYQKMPGKEKLAYLKKLVGETVLKEMTTTRLARGVVGKMMAETAPEAQKALFDDLAPGLDFFTKSSIQNAYKE